ncbi:MAG: M1 family aminopeptidase [Candidatus Zixiibacteriota bacterium]
MNPRFAVPLYLLLLAVSAGLTLPAQALALNAGPDVSPAEMHREMAEAKTRALKRGADWTLRPAAVVDVAGYNALYYDLDLNITNVAVVQNVIGKVTMVARAQAPNYSTPTMNFLAPMVVDSVFSGGQPISYSHVSGFLYLTLNSSYNVGEEFEVTVFYHGKPTTGGFQGFYFGTHGTGTPMISTLSEPYMAQSWWPCKDTPSDKADSVDIRVTVDDLFYAACNGNLRDSVNHGDGTITYWWHEQYPITTYLVSLAITDYARFDRWYHHGPSDSMPVRFYSYPELIADAQTYWPIAVDQIEFYSQVFGEYPFLEEKYGMAHFPWGGAMEHQTVTSATSGSFGFNQYLIAHELAHQWWGDMVTCRDWHHIWMNEGFASYAEALWAEHLGGTSSYRSYMSGMQYWTGGRIYIDDTTDVGNIFSSRVYDKGAWVLHMLRGVIGDQDFFDLWQAYYNDPAFQHKDIITEEFRDLAESVSGEELDEFFNDWIYGYYYPKYAVSWMAEFRQDNFYDVFVHIRQYQTTTPQVFDLPVELRLDGVGGSPIVRVTNNKRDQDFVIQTPTAPTGVTLDPNVWILKGYMTETYGLNLVTESLLVATQYTPHSDMLIAKGGTPPYEFTVAAGPLPAGLTLNTSTGEISGLPTTTIATPVTLGVWSNGHTVYKQKSFTLTVAPLPYVIGDQDGSGLVDAVDLALLIDHVFFGAAAPNPPEAADMNRDCLADATDLAILIDNVYFGGTYYIAGCAL